MQPDDGLDVTKTCIVFINNTENNCAQKGFFFVVVQEY